MTFFLVFAAIALHAGGYLGAVSAIERGGSITLNVAMCGLTSTISALLFAYVFMQM